MNNAECHHHRSTRPREARGHLRPEQWLCFLESDPELRLSRRPEQRDAGANDLVSKVLGRQPITV